MAKLIDERGRRYGRLLVIRRAENSKAGIAQWLCHCDCGQESIATGTNLRNGNTQSCDCLRKEHAFVAQFIDKTGQKYGRLTVIEKSNFNIHRRIAWHCKCDCGRIILATGSSLQTGNTKSCGCLYADTVPLPKGEASFNALFTRMKSDAKRRKHEWGLTKEQVRILTQQPCYYCNIEPKQGHLNTAHNGTYFYNGLDRINNNIGYIPNNVVPCCRACNMAKNAMTIKQFRDWICRIYNHFANTFRENNH